MPAPVLKAITDHLQLEARIGGYEAAKQAQGLVEHTYDAIARLLNAERSEIAVLDSATTAWQRAFYSVPLEKGDRIVTARAAYASNFIAMLQRKHRDGVDIIVVPDDEHGQVDVAALREQIDERVKLICLTHIPTGGGLVNPAAAVGEVAKAAGVLFLLDACQSAGHLPLDVTEIGCDFLSATGRKYLRGPRGTGFLYARRAVLENMEPHVIDLHAAEWTSTDRYELRGDARRFESWERNVAAHIGLGVAVDYAEAWGVEATWPRVRDLARTLRQTLSALPGVVIHDRGMVQSGIVTFTKVGILASDVVSRLMAQGINTSLAVRSGTRLDWEARALHEAVRASVHYYNSEEEIERFAGAVADL